MRGYHPGIPAADTGRSAKEETPMDAKRTPGDARRTTDGALRAMEAPPTPTDPHRRTALRTLAAAAGSMTAGAAWTQTSAPGAAVRIGYVSPQTGPLAPFGE